jgi:hypothetical protein
MEYIKGQFAKIPERFSGDLWEILKSLLNVQPETRLNCGNMGLENRPNIEASSYS